MVLGSGVRTRPTTERTPTCAQPWFPFASDEARRLIWLAGSNVVLKPVLIEEVGELFERLGYPFEPGMISRPSEAVPQSDAEASAGRVGTHGGKAVAQTPSDSHPDRSK
jgi:hypothetical protein